MKTSIIYTLVWVTHHFCMFLKQHRKIEFLHRQLLAVLVILNLTTNLARMLICLPQPRQQRQFANVEPDVIERVRKESPKSSRSLIFIQCAFMDNSACGASSALQAPTPAHCRQLCSHWTPGYARSYIYWLLAL